MVNSKRTHPGKVYFISQKQGSEALSDLPELVFKFIQLAVEPECLCIRQLKFFATLCVSTNHHRSTMSVDFGVTNKYILTSGQICK